MNCITFSFLGSFLTEILSSPLFSLQSFPVFLKRDKMPLIRNRETSRTSLNVSRQTRTMVLVWLFDPIKYLVRKACLLLLPLLGRLLLIGTEEVNLRIKLS